MIPEIIQNGDSRSSRSRIVFDFFQDVCVLKSCQEIFNGKAGEAIRSHTPFIKPSHMRDPELVVFQASCEPCYKSCWRSINALNLLRKFYDYKFCTDSCRGFNASVQILFVEI